MSRLTLAQLLQTKAGARMAGIVKQSAESNSRAQKEAQIHDDISNLLKSYGLGCYYVHSRMDRAHTNKVGTPDFIGWLYGKPFALEVKRHGKKETREQAGELMRCQLAGGTVAIVHSVDEAREVLEGGKS